MNKELDTYHDYGKISRVVTGIDILAWVSLIISGVLTLLYIIRSVPTLQLSNVDAWLQFLAPLPQLLQGAFWFIILNVLKEGLYILLDIEENSRPDETDGQANVYASAATPAPVMDYDYEDDAEDDLEDDPEEEDELD